MIGKIILLAAADSIVLATGASALPFNPLREGSSVGQAHMVCDLYGRCWETGGVWVGHHHHDWDHDDWDHHRHHRDWDHDD